jgi:hypothetical protein
VAPSASTPALPRTLRYRCEEHGVTVEVDTQARIVRYRADPLSAGSRQSPPGCEVLRVAHEGLRDPARPLGPRGPVHPRTGRHTCEIVEVQ